MLLFSIAVNTVERQCSWEAAFFHRSTRRKDQCSVVSDTIHWFQVCGWVTWVFFEVISSLIRSIACYMARESGASFSYHVGKCISWHCPDLCICYMTSVRDPRDLAESPCYKCVYLGCFTSIYQETAGVFLQAHACPSAKSMVSRAE